MTAALQTLTVDGPDVRQLLDTVSEQHDLIFMLDEDERVVWASEDLADLFSGPAGVLGVGVDALLEAGVELEKLRQSVRVSLAGATRLRLTCPGSPLVDANAFRIRPDSPLVVVVVRRVDQELPSVSDAAFLRRVLDNAPNAVIATELGGFVTYANPAAATLLERTRRELVGRPLPIFLSNPRGLVEIMEALRTEDVSGRDIELVREDGSVRWLSVSADRLRLPDGRGAGSVLFLHDVTARKLMEAELERKNDELESYVLNVSHDLRSPLVSVRGFARLLRDDYESVLDESGRRFLDRIEQAGRTMETLIEELLELSRIGRSEEPMSLVDPRAVLRQIAADLKPELDAKDITLTLPAQPPMLRCNRTRLYQLFSNLVTNAAVHMGPTDDARIDVRIETLPDHWDIVVSDNGRGVSDENHERIFEIFTTLGPCPDGRKTTGIGLATVRKISSMHGGQAWVESTPGEGATFHTTLRRN